MSMEANTNTTTVENDTLLPEGNGWCVRLAEAPPRPEGSGAYKRHLFTSRFCRRADALGYIAAAADDLSRDAGPADRLLAHSSYRCEPGSVRAPYALGRDSVLVEATPAGDWVLLRVTAAVMGCHADASRRAAAYANELLDAMAEADPSPAAWERAVALCETVLRDHSPPSRFPEFTAAVERVRGLRQRLVEPVEVAADAAGAHYGGKLSKAQLHAALIRSGQIPTPII